LADHFRQSYSCNNKYRAGAALFDYFNRLHSAYTGDPIYSLCFPTRV